MIHVPIVYTLTTKLFSCSNNSTVFPQDTWQVKLAMILKTIRIVTLCGNSGPLLKWGTLVIQAERKLLMVCSKINGIASASIHHAVSPAHSIYVCTFVFKEVLNQSHVTTHYTNN